MSDYTYSTKTSKLLLIADKFIVNLDEVVLMKKEDHEYHHIYSIIFGLKSKEQSEQVQFTTAAERDNCFAAIWREINK